MPGNGTVQSLRWCFTLNNPTDDELALLRGLTSADGVGFIIFGRETGDSGTPHLQGYLELGRPWRFNRVKKLSGFSRAHLEVARGSAEQSIEYCSKEDHTPYSYGTPRVGQGARSDLAEVKTMLDSGQSLRDVARVHFGTFIRYHRGLSQYNQLNVVPRNWRTQCVWIYGPTGTGKSRFAATDSQKLCLESVWWSPYPDLSWFDTYNSERGVVLDEFTRGAPLFKLLRLLDRYPLAVPVKGSTVQFVARIVWITSNFSPCDIYGDEPQYPALMRRIDEVKFMD